MEHTTPFTPVARSRTARLLPLLWGGAIAAVAIVALVAAAPRGTDDVGGSTNAIFAAAVSPDASAAAAPKFSVGKRGDADGWQAGPGAMGAMGLGGPGLGGRGGHGLGPISITAISGSQLSLRTDSGWTRTIDAADADVYRGETEIALADLRIGDQIAFREVRTSDGTTAIARIQVLDPSVAGTITAVTGSSVTVRLPDGSTKTIQTTGTTTYALGRDEAATRDAALVVGNVLRATGTVSGDTFTATAIHVQPAMIGGEVTAKTATSITVTDVTGASRTINVSSETTFLVRGDDTPSLDDIAVGDGVVAQGTLRADGSLDATRVAEGRGPGDGGPGFGARGGRGGHGPGGFDRDDDDPNASPATSS